MFKRCNLRVFSSCDFTLPTHVIIKQLRSSDGTFCPLWGQASQGEKATPLSKSGLTQGHRHHDNKVSTRTAHGLPIGKTSFFFQGNMNQKYLLPASWTFRGRGNPLVSSFRATRTMCYFPSPSSQRLTAAVFIPNTTSIQILRCPQRCCPAPLAVKGTEWIPREHNWDRGDKLQGVLLTECKEGLSECGEFLRRLRMTPLPARLKLEGHSHISGTSAQGDTHTQ